MRLYFGKILYFLILLVVVHGLNFAWPKQNQKQIKINHKLHLTGICPNCLSVETFKLGKRKNSTALIVEKSWGNYLLILVNIFPREPGWKVQKSILPASDKSRICFYQEVGDIPVCKVLQNFSAALYSLKQGHICINYFWIWGETTCSFPKIICRLNYREDSKGLVSP